MRKLQKYKMWMEKEPGQNQDEALLVVLREINKNRGYCSRKEKKKKQANVNLAMIMGASPATTKRLLQAAFDGYSPTVKKTC
jgi:NADH:ubiquinone oxidoreductase subunit E